MHAVLEQAGLERYYELGGGAPVGAIPAPGRRDWLAEVERRGRLADGLQRVMLDVQGIRCAACVWVLQELWRRRDGGLRLELNPGLGRATLFYDPRRLRLSDYLDDVERLGYRVAPASKRPSRRDRDLLVRLGVCAALAMNAMMFALARYLGLEAEGGPLAELFGLLALALATAAVLVGGPVFFQAALGGLRRRVLHLDLPVSLGILLAYGGSLYHYLAGGGEGYFDTVTVFVALMLAGRWLQQRAITRNRDLLLANDGAEHLRARAVDGNRIREVPVTSLRAGMRLLVAPGDLVPADAALEDRDGAFSLDWIRGESTPRRFAAGDVVPAGAFCCAEGARRLRVIASAEDSGLLRLLGEPLRDPDDPRGRTRFWERVNRLYVAAVLVLAAGGAALWAVVEPGRAMAVATSVLVVTCPCALGIATPLAFELALGALRRRGVYVRTQSLLEKARHVRKVVFDKTGTLTWGGLRARRREARELAPDAARVLYTMASSSSHPVARAVAAAAAETGGGAPRLLEGLRVRELPGRGLEAVYRGVSYRLGRPEFATRSPDARGDCVFAADGRLLAAFDLEEDYREGAGAELAALTLEGVRIYLASGDDPAKVARAAARLGVPPAQARGGLTPEDKARWVAELDEDDTMIVGDGLNDAPAFEAAFCAGTVALDRPVMPARSDFAVVGRGIEAPRLVRSLARRVHRTIRTNLVLAGTYNALAVSLAYAGWMSPLLCAVLMPLSSLALVAHTTARLRPGTEAVS